MFRNKIVRWGTVGFLIVILVYVFADTFKTDAREEVINPEMYVDLIRHEREDKDESFRTSDESPIPDKGSFHGLHYFEPDLAYRVRADIRVYNGSEKKFEIAYTDGSKDSYERFGYADFTLGGQKASLLLLKHDGVLSLLFKDETSGKETYGGGRYIDFKMSDLKGNSLVVDFNKAYSPYCAYDVNYACPLPPKENVLKISVRAGEKYELEK